MLEKIKKSLRITHNALDEEVQDLIDAALLDLKLSGVNKLVETDALIIRAVTCYCKAEFGYNNTEAERFKESFEMLKAHLSLAGDYR